jgi:hypothetical protein
MLHLTTTHKILMHIWKGRGRSWEHVWNAIYSRPVGGIGGGREFIVGVINDNHFIGVALLRVSSYYGVR